MKSVSKIEYPFYSTNDDKMDLSKDCLINPYDEFIEFSIRTFYPKLNCKELSIEEYFLSSEEERTGYLIDILGDYSKDILFIPGDKKEANAKNGAISVDIIDIIKDDNKCCSVSVCKSDLIYIDDKIESPHFAIKVTFYENESLSYIIKNLKMNEFVFQEIVYDEFKKNQLNVVCAVIAGILNINEYIRFHKINGIKMSTISSYLSAYPKLNSHLYIVYNYDSAYLTYATDTDFKMCELKYDNFIDDIDKLIEKYGC